MSEDEISFCLGVEDLNAHYYSLLGPGEEQTVVGSAMGESGVEIQRRLELDCPQDNAAPPF